MTKTEEHRAVHIKEAVAHYKDHDIYLDTAMTFCAVGPLIDDLAGYGRGTSSLQQAKDAIDEAHKTKVKEAKTAEKLSLMVIAADGTRINIRGINSNTGDLLFTPPQKDRVDVFAPAPWVEDLLRERKLLRAQLDKVTKELNRVEINFRSYGRIPPHRYDEKIEELKGLHAKAVEEAAKPPKA